MKKFNSVSDLVRDLQPVNPVYCIRPESIKLACNFFVNNFPGKPLYAVKTNPHKSVIKHIYQNGITNFDVASLEEIKLVNSITKDAKLYFMHTVKNRKSIEEAYFNYGVRDFSFDTKDELPDYQMAKGIRFSSISYVLNEKVKMIDELHTLISNSNYSSISDEKVIVGKHLDDMTRVIIKFNSL